MRWIKDSIHGDVFVSNLANELIDTPQFQRLRRVLQTSFSNLIYPGANHTRFEHSLGTYYLTARGALFHNMSDQKTSKLSITALLHDIGHPCFSHALEYVLEKHTGKNHEDYSADIIRSGEVKEVLQANGIDPEDIISLYRSDEGQLITGELGTDRMDYLLRDSKYTGVAYGAVDVDRILRKLKMHDGKWVLDESGLSAAEAMLLARFMMFPSVYYHYVPNTAGVMMNRAAEYAISTGMMKAEDLVKWDDYEFVARLKQDEGYAGDMIRRLLDRKLYKAAYQKPLKVFPNWIEIAGMSVEQKKEIEKEIARKAGVDERHVVFEVPKAWFGDIKINVLRDNDIYSINEVSIISRILKEAQWDYAKVTVMCREEDVSKVKEVAEQELQRVSESTM